MSTSNMELSADYLKTILARVKAAGFDHAEVIGSSDAATEMQIDAGDISLLRDTENIGLTLRGLMGGRYASVSLNQLDTKSVDGGIAKMREAAQAAPVDEARAFASKHDAKPIVEGAHEPSLEDMYGRVNAFALEVSKRHPEIKLEQSALKFQRDRMVRVNSHGLELDETEGYYSFGAMFTSKRGEKMSSFNFSGAVSKDLSKDLIQWGAFERLMANSVKEIDHAPFEGKHKIPVLLAPEVVFDLMGTWFSHLQDLRLIADTSQLKGKIGEQVASPLLTVRAEPRSAEFAKHEHSTGDGYASKPSTVLEKGVLKTYLLSDYGSRKTGLPRAENNFSNSVIEAGASSVDDMIKGIKHGLMLARFSGGNPSANGDFSGVAKNSFLIENGRITRPVSEVSISGNAFELMKSVTAVSRERLNDGASLTPWIQVDGLTLSGS